MGRKRKEESRASENTVERLSQYRRALLNNRVLGPQVFSYRLAAACSVGAAQVRRDLMAIGVTGTPARGYERDDLMAALGAFLDADDIERIAIVGVGQIGKAVIDFLNGRRPKLRIVAGFDSNPEKVDRVVHGVRVYAVEQIATVVPAERVRLAILTLPVAGAQAATDALVAAGVTGILNMAPVSLNTPKHVYAASLDMTIALERVAFFARAGHPPKDEP